MQTLTLYTYFRSSAAFRVRIALNLKGLTCESKTIDLLKDGGEEKTAQYAQINPQKLVPAFCDGDQIITQSLAIIEYLEEKYPEPALLPKEPIMRAKVRALALSVACDIHPLNNLRVVKHIADEFDADEMQKKQWMHHWMAEGFSAIEMQLNNSNSKDYCFGSSVSLADLMLIPQVYNARRFECEMSLYPRINSIYEQCMENAAFIAASPEKQGDYHG